MGIMWDGDVGPAPAPAPALETFDMKVAIRLWCEAYGERKLIAYCATCGMDEARALEIADRIADWNSDGE